MRLAKSLICGLLLAAVAGTALAGELSRGLEEVLAANADSDPVRALVVMSDRVDITSLDQTLHDQEVDLATRHVTVIQTLKEDATRAQADLLVDLEERQRRGEIEGYHAHWIINAIMITGTEQAIREIAAREDVEIVEADLQVELIEPVKRYGDPDKDGAGIGITPGVVNIGARRVWDELGIRGEGAIIASLDTGVDGNHPALASRWRGLNAPWEEAWLDVLGSPSQFPQDSNGHGTHCTGTMTGVAEDDTIGVAPAAEWIAANAIGQGAGGGFDSDVIACFEWFADPDGDPFTLDDVPDVVQNSWGVHEGFGYPDCDSRWWSVIDACEAAGAVVVFAAGNEGPSSSSIRSPGDRATTLTNCFTVGATSHSPPHGIASYSSRGPSGPNCGPVENRTKPEVVAPGSGIYSAAPGGGYTYMDGTSMATPHVCGVVALMRSANPNVDVITIKEVLMATAVDLGGAGEENTYGNGFIDAFQAVTAVMTGFGTVQGTVTDRVTGFPIEGVQITIDDAYQTAVSDAFGNFELLVSAGAQILNGSIFAYADASVEVEVVEDQVSATAIVMDPLPTKTVSGVVYLPGGNPGDGGTPAADVLIIIKDTPVDPVTSGADGTYAVALPAGASYELQVSAGMDGYLGLMVPFADDLELDLYLNSVFGDGFETGDMSGLDWYFSGGADWYAQSDEVLTGNYASRSGAIGNTSLSQMQAFVDCGDGGEVSFWLKVSCASGDILAFYVGNDKVGEWSGEVEWTRASYPVPGGVVSFRWRYQKDGSGSGGQDAAFVDNIVFPGGADPFPQLVAAPVVVVAEAESGDMVDAPGHLFNMGGADLNWSLSESASWLTIAPDNGAVVPGDFQTLTFGFDAAGLADGSYEAAVTVDSDDPADPVTNLVARLVVGETVTASPELPERFALVGAVPNPFNPMTTVRFTLPANQHARLGVYDVAGHLVRTLVDEARPAGANEVNWDGRDANGRAVSSGTYYARLLSGNEVSVKSMVLVR